MGHHTLKNPKGLTMKIEFAPPGTDPTRIPSSPPRMEPNFVHDNWLLLVGIAIFAIMTS
jgi:hypothetical protein